MYDNSIVPSETRMKDIYNVLKNDGFDVYFIGQHKGFCERPYTVIKNSGASKLDSCSTNEVVIELMCYVPLKNSSTIDAYVDSVKVSMKRLYPMIKDRNNDLSDYEDSDVKAVMRTIQYSFYRKIEY